MTPSASGIVTLTTDFGLEDAYAAALEGAIREQHRDVLIAHVSHLVPPGDIRAGAYLVEYAARSFPVGTVHLGVVDPGVGTDRMILAVATERCYLVGPDNGVLRRALRGSAEPVAVRLALPADLESWTFQSRDVMAPAAARLAAGAPLHELGEAIALRPEQPAPLLSAGEGRVAEVAHVDHFGTLVFDLRHPGAWPEDARELWVGGGPVALGRTFGDVKSGALVAYRGSIGYLEVAARDGSAAAALGLHAGETAEVKLL
jgi:S-adenosylmethionine hydrolase